MWQGEMPARVAHGERTRAAVLLATLALLGLIAAARAPGAVAHAVLVRSDPGQNARLGASPDRIDLFFSEALDRKFSTVQVRDTAGTPKDKHDVHFTSDPTEMLVGVPALPPGFYTVTWTTVSAVDGHRLEGAFPITVLNPDGSSPAGALPVITTGSGAATGVQPVDSVLRWLLLIGLIGVTGGYGFALFVLYPAAAAEPPGIGTQAFALRWLGRLVPLGAALVILSDLVTLPRQALQAGSLGDLGSVLSRLSGRYLALRIGLILLAAALAWPLLRRVRSNSVGFVYSTLSVGLLLGLGALLTMSLTSHAAAGAGADWAVPIDFAHLSAVSLWLGGLVQVPLLLGEHGRNLRVSGRALQRYSIMALLCVGAVLLSGTFNALVQVASFSAMTDTAYGRALLVKLALLLPLLGLGLLNATRIARRFERQALDEQPDAERQAVRLVRSAVCESVAGALVVAATAVLVFLVPSTQAAAQGQARSASSKAAPVSSVYRNQAAASDLTAALTVSPNRVGANDFRVQLTGPDVTAITRVQFRFQSVDRPVGQSQVTADPVAGTAGLFSATAANFSFVGRWGVTINVRRDGHDDANAAFTVEVPDVNGATTSSLTTATRSPTAFPAHGISAQQAWGVLLVAGGLVLFVFRRRLWTMNPWAGTASVFGISLAVIVGIAIVAGGRLQVRNAPVLQNPVAADQRSVLNGKQLFATNCAQCHGATGHGDGPLAAGLNPKPLDLTVHAGLHPDYQLYDWITNGIQRSAMPAWKAKLSDQQRWDLVNYLRTLSGGTDTQAAATPTP